MQQATRVEKRIDAYADRVLAAPPTRGPKAFAINFAVFVLKQAWACVFGAALLVVILAARLWYPDDALVARNDALTIAAIVIQILMLVFRLESGREVWVILLFHLTGTVMELFKTDVGSWAYAAEGVLRIGGVPLFSGFMYAAVGSYLVRVYRLFELRFTRYPPVWATSILAALIYLNFFTHHYWWDARWVLTAAVVALWFPTIMSVRVRATIRLPILLAFLGVAAFIFAAENIATWAGAWLYPNQVDGWHPVSLSKLSSWFLLMIISIVMVTWVYPPQRAASPQPANTDSTGPQIERPSSATNSRSTTRPTGS